MRSLTLAVAMCGALCLLSMDASAQRSSTEVTRRLDSLTVTLEDGHTLTVKNACVMKRSNPGWVPTRYETPVDAIRLFRWLPKAQSSDTEKEEKVISLLDIEAIEYPQHLRSKHSGACIIMMRDRRQVVVGVPGRDFTPANYGQVAAKVALAGDLLHDYAWNPDEYQIAGTWADSDSVFISDMGQLLSYPYTVPRPSDFTRISRIVFNTAPERHK
jgi:hypothetical protein